MRLALVVVVVACGQDERASQIHTTSAELPTLAARRELLERYVTFRRTYRTLDFALDFHDNSGGRVPGPSDWDIALVATIPRSELPLWLDGMTPTNAQLDWIASVPTSIQVHPHAVYADGKRTLVVDDRGGDTVIAYHNAN